MAADTMHIQLQASIALLLAQLSFSGWHILGSVSFHDGADPIVFCLYRIILGTFLMHLYVKFYGMSIVIDTADYTRFLFLGIMSFCSMILTALCLRYIAPSRFAIFQPSIPCIVAGLSMVLGLEKMSIVKLLGIVVAVAGALLAEMWKFQASDNAELNISLGSCLAVGQVGAMGALLVGVKPLLNKYQPAVVSCVYFSIATVLTVLLCIARVDIFPPGAFNFNGQVMPWIALVYAAVFTTLFAFIALSWGGKYLNPTVSTVYFTFQPVGTIVLSSVILGSAVTLPEILGGLLILMGLGITSTAALLGPKEEEPGSEESTDDGNSGGHVAPGITFNQNLNNNAAFSTINTSTVTADPSADWPGSSIELLKAAYRNQTSSLLRSSRHSGHTYNAVSTEEAMDVESGQGAAASSNAASPRSSSADNLAQGSGGSKGIAFSLQAPDTTDYTQYDHEPQEHTPPPILSAHSTKVGIMSPVRLRSVTVDSPSTSSSTLLRRNQTSFNA